MKRRNKKNKLIAILCSVLVFMSVGYATLSETLKLAATGNINSSFKVVIDSITEKENSGASNIVTNVSDPKDENASFNVDLNAPGDYVTFTVKVKNTGTINAILSKVDTLLEPDEEFEEYLTTNNLKVRDIYEITTTSEPNTKIEFGNNNTYEFDVTLKYKTSAKVIPIGSVTSKININYNQETDNAIFIPPVDEPAFTVSSLGHLSLNYPPAVELDENGYLVAPSEVNGIQVKSVYYYSFGFFNIKLVCNDSTLCNNPKAIIIFDEENYNHIKELINEKYGNVDIYKYSEIVNQEIDLGRYFQNQAYIDDELNVEINTYEKYKKIDLSSVKITKMQNNGLIKSTIEYLILPNSLTSISDVTSNKCSLKYVKLPDGLVSIGQNAFQNCNLESLEIPNSVTSIETGAFSNSKIKKLILSNGLKEIKSATFMNNEINSLKIPNGIEKIGTNAFRNNNIVDLEISSSVKEIGNIAFDNNKISNLIIPEGVTQIGSMAFSNNEIKTLSLPSTINYIGASTFANNQLTSMSIPNNITEIRGNAFANNLLTSVTLHDNITTIGSKAFTNNKLTNIDIPKSVTTISSNAFSNNEIELLNIPSNITTIDENAFSNNKITSLEIPNSVLTINQKAFENNLIETLSIQNGITTINDGVFTNNKISSLNLPDSIKTIGSNSFQNNNITSLSLPSNIETIKMYAFYGNNLNNLTIPGCIKSIGLDAFRSNPNLTTIHINGAYDSNRTFGGNWNGTATVIYDVE